MSHDYRALLSLCSQAPESLRLPVDERASHYFEVVLATRRHLAPTVERPIRRIVPFWAAWNVADSERPEAIVDCVRQALTCETADCATPPRSETVQLNFLRSHTDGKDRLRGRAKFTVEVPPDATESELGLIAQRSQERVTKVRESAAPIPTAHLEMIHVAWGEHWLVPRV